MAEGLLRRRAAHDGVDARIHSAGLLEDGRAATSDGILAMAARGVDTTAHLSRRMTVEMLEAADVVVAMAREHVREAVILVPGCWSRAFTLKELIRRGEDAGSRSPGQTVDDWLAKVHAGRSRADLLGMSEVDDVADPIGQGLAVYERTADELDDLTRRLADLLWGAVDG
jgi:protein-tyrosine phosphatase